MLTHSASLLPFVFCTTAVCVPKRHVCVDFRFSKYPQIYQDWKSGWASTVWGPTCEKFLCLLSTGDPNGFFKTWYLSWEEYPCKHFPIFFVGMITTWSMHTLKLSFTAAHFARPLSIDDSFLGVIGSKLGVHKTMIDELVVLHPSYLDINCKTLPRIKNDLFYTHLAHKNQRVRLWQTC